MDKAEQLGPDTYEGTWEELSQVASKFNGHRLRLQVIGDKGPTGIRWAKPGAYAEYVRKEMAELEKLPPATEEEIRQEEEELKELMRNMNETRRRGGAEPIFPDV